MVNLVGNQRGHRPLRVVPDSNAAVFVEFTQPLRRTDPEKTFIGAVFFNKMYAAMVEGVAQGQAPRAGAGGRTDENPVFPIRSIVVAGHPQPAFRVAVKGSDADVGLVAGLEKHLTGRSARFFGVVQAFVVAAEPPAAVAVFVCAVDVVFYQVPPRKLLVKRKPYRLPVQLVQPVGAADPEVVKAVGKREVDGGLLHAFARRVGQAGELVRLRPIKKQAAGKKTDPTVGPHLVNQAQRRKFHSGKNHAGELPPVGVPGIRLILREIPQHAG